MRALVMTTPTDDATATRVDDLGEPRPGPGEVAIDVAYAGINFIDVMARRGDPGYASSWPYVPGLEIAGTVRAVGSGVADRRVGDRVAAFTAGGGLAEVAIARDAVTVGVPDAIPLDIAASAPLVLSTALLLLTDVARIRPGESVLMHSAGGGVGSAVARLAKTIGTGLTIGTVGRPEKVNDAEHAGWDVSLSRHGDLLSSIREAAPGGVDVVLDPTGTALLDLDLEVSAPGARVVLFGNAGGGTPAPLPGVGRLIGGNVCLAGFSMSRLVANAPERAAGALRRVLQMIEAGRPAPSVTVVESLDSVGGVHDLLAAGRGRGKYVVRVAS
jgi:NADPH:quinone reductase